MGRQWPQGPFQGMETHIQISTGGKVTTGGLSVEQEGVVGTGATVRL